MSLIKSDSLNELASALVKFQKEMPAIERSKTVSVGDKFSFDYAPLDQIVEKATPILTKNGLCVSQLVGENGAVTTVLLHESGQYLGETVTIHPTSDRPQDLGSAITYAKRYSYASILGIVAEDDDDANRASGNKFTYPERGRREEEEKPWLNEGTPEWEKTVAKLRSGQVNTDTVYQHFRVNKRNRQQLEEIEQSASPEPA
jgi:hypothetical protein